MHENHRPKTCNIVTKYQNILCDVWKPSVDFPIVDFDYKHCIAFILLNDWP